MEYDTLVRGAQVIGAVEEVIVVEDREGRIEEIIVEEVIVEQPENHHHHQDNLFIFVNRLRKTEQDGVKHEMTGGEIAALAKIPSENAVVKQEKDGKNVEIAIGDKIVVCKGEQFLVTREKVNGGHG